MEKKPKEQASAEAGAAKEGEDYSTDRPISTPEEDRFDRWPFAQRVAEIIERRKDAASLVVGIYGPWGDGKTSSLRLLERALDVHREHVIVVKYNPWYFREVPQLLRGFFATLSGPLEKALDATDPSRISRWWRRVKRSGESFGSLLGRYEKLI